jgi:hypothetical protein
LLAAYLMARQRFRNTLGPFQKLLLFRCIAQALVGVAWGAREKRTGMWI